MRKVLFLLLMMTFIMTALNAQLPIEQTFPLGTDLWENFTPIGNVSVPINGWLTFANDANVVNPESSIVMENYHTLLHNYDEITHFKFEFMYRATTATSNNTIVLFRWQGDEYFNKGYILTINKNGTITVDRYAPGQGKLTIFNSGTTPIPGFITSNNGSNAFVLTGHRNFYSLQVNNNVSIFEWEDLYETTNPLLSIGKIGLGYQKEASTSTLRSNYFRVYEYLIPQNVKARVRETDKIDITWNSVWKDSQTQADQYILRTFVNYQEQSQYVVPNSETAHRIDYSSNLGTYSYTVEAVFVGDSTPFKGQSKMTSLKTVPALPTSGLDYDYVFTNGNFRNIQFRWNAAPGASSYNLYRGNYEYPVSNTTANERLITNFGNGNYTYHVAVTYNQIGAWELGNYDESSKISTPSFTINNTPPLVSDDNMSITKTYNENSEPTTYDVTLEWNRPRSISVTGYEIQRSSNDGSNWTTLESNHSALILGSLQYTMEYTDSDVVVGTYLYRVRPVYEGYTSNSAINYTNFDEINLPELEKVMNVNVEPIKVAGDPNDYNNHWQNVITWENPVHASFTQVLIQRKNVTVITRVEPEFETIATLDITDNTTTPLPTTYTDGLEASYLTPGTYQYQVITKYGTVELAPVPGYLKDSNPQEVDIVLDVYQFENPVIDAQDNDFVIVKSNEGAKTTYDLDIIWSKSDYADSYTVERKVKDTNDDTYQNINIEPTFSEINSKYTLTDENIDAGEYTYRVRAIFNNGDDYSEYVTSNRILNQLNPVTSLTADIDDKKITLNFIAPKMIDTDDVYTSYNSMPLQGFHLYEKSDNEYSQVTSPFTLFTPDITTQAAIVIDNRTQGTYSYKIMAVYDTGINNETEITDIHVSDLNDVTITDHEVIYNNSDHNIKLTWTTPTGIHEPALIGYNVYYDNNEEPLNGETLIAKNTLNYTDLNNRAADTDHKYTVVAVYDGGESTGTEYTVNFIEFPAPQNLTVANEVIVENENRTGDKITLTWEAPKDEEAITGKPVMYYYLYTTQSSISLNVNDLTLNEGIFTYETNLNNYTSRDYKVAARYIDDNQTNQSDFVDSDPEIIWELLPVEDLTANATLTDNQVTLKWKANIGVAAGINGFKLQVGTDEPTTHTDLVADGDGYYQYTYNQTFNENTVYKVTALYTTEQFESLPESVSTQLHSTPAPTAGAISVAGDIITLEWTAPVLVTNQQRSNTKNRTLVGRVHKGYEFGYKSDTSRSEEYSTITATSPEEVIATTTSAAITLETQGTFTFAIRATYDYPDETTAVSDWVPFDPIKKSNLFEVSTISHKIIFTNLNHNIELTWTVPSDIHEPALQGYNVFYGEDEAPLNGETLITKTTLDYTDTENRDPDTNHQYTIKAVYENGESDGEEYIVSFIEFPAPQNLTVANEVIVENENRTGDKITLTWEAPKDEEAITGKPVMYYYLYTTQSSISLNVNDLTLNEGIFTYETNLNNYTSRDYKVAARYIDDNQTNQSDFVDSDPEIIWELLPVEDLTANATLTDNQVTLKWKANIGVAAGINGFKLQVGTDEPTTHTDLVADGDGYYQYTYNQTFNENTVYKVTALYTTEQFESLPESVSTQLHSTPAPTAGAISVAGDIITLEWTAPVLVTNQQRSNTKNRTLVGRVHTGYEFGYKVITSRNDDYTQITATTPEEIIATTTSAAITLENQGTFTFAIRATYDYPDETTAVSDWVPFSQIKKSALLEVTNLTHVLSNDKKVTLNWEKPTLSGENGFYQDAFVSYKIFVDDAENPVTTITDYNTETYSFDTAIDADTRYKYTVQVVYTNGIANEDEYAVWYQNFISNFTATNEILNNGEKITFTWTHEETDPNHDGDDYQTGYIISVIDEDGNLTELIDTDSDNLNYELMLIDENDPYNYIISYDLAQLGYTEKDFVIQVKYDSETFGEYQEESVLSEISASTKIYELIAPYDLSVAYVNHNQATLSWKLTKVHGEITNFNLKVNDTDPAAIEVTPSDETGYYSYTHTVYTEYDDDTAFAVQTVYTSGNSAFSDPASIEIYNAPNPMALAVDYDENNIDQVTLSWEAPDMYEITTNQSKNNRNQSERYLRGYQYGKISNGSFVTTPTAITITSTSAIVNAGYGTHNYGIRAVYYSNENDAYDVNLFWHSKIVAFDEFYLSPIYEVSNISHTKHLENSDYIIKLKWDEPTGQDYNTLALKGYNIYLGTESPNTNGLNSKNNLISQKFVSNRGQVSNYTWGTALNENELIAKSDNGEIKYEFTVPEEDYIAIDGKYVFKVEAVYYSKSSTGVEYEVDFVKYPAPEIALNQHQLLPDGLNENATYDLVSITSITGQDLFDSSKYLMHVFFDGSTVQNAGMTFNDFPVNNSINYAQYLTYQNYADVKVKANYGNNNYSEYSNTIRIYKLKAPTDLVASTTNTTDEVTLTWNVDLPEGFDFDDVIDGFNIYETSGLFSATEGKITVTPTLSGNEVSHTLNIGWDTERTFKVSTIFKSGESAKSNEATAKIHLTPAPVVVSASNFAREVTLEWEAPVLTTTNNRGSITSTRELLGYRLYSSDTTTPGAITASTAVVVTSNNVTLDESTSWYSTLGNGNLQAIFEYPSTGEKTFYIGAYYELTDSEESVSYEVVIAASAFETLTLTNFAKVWSGNGFQHMNFFVHDVDQTIGIDRIGFGLAVGDEIGVFAKNEENEEKCVGVTIITQNILDAFNQDPTVPIKVVTSLLNEYQDGFNNGDEIIVKIWDNSAETEITSIFRDIFMHNGNPIAASADITFAPNAVAHMNLIPADGTANQTLTLIPGWNIISTNVNLGNDDNNRLMTTAFGNLFYEDSYANSNIKKVIPMLPQAPIAYVSDAWTGTGLDFNFNQSYRVYIDAENDEELTLSGSTVRSGIQADMELTVDQAGWYLFGVPYEYNIAKLELGFPIFTFFGNNYDKIDRILDQAGNLWERPLYSKNNTTVQEFEVLTPGQGYYVFVNAPFTNNKHVYERITLINKSTSSEEEPIVLNPTHFTPVWHGNGSLHHNTIIRIDELFASVINANSEIAVFDGNVCVGVSVYNEQENYITIKSSLADEFQSGYTPGNNLSIRIWNVDTETVIVNPTLELISGSFEFGVMGRTEIRISDFTSQDEIVAIPVITEISAIYPNPFNPTTNIKYSSAVAGNVILVVYNVKGQKVATLASGHHEAGHYNIIWNGTDHNNKKVASGVYFTRLITPDKQVVRKMVMMK